MNRNQINTLLKELRLAGIRKHLDRELQTATASSSGYLEFFVALLLLEVDARRINRTERFLNRSRLPLSKKLSAFDQKHLSLKLRQQMKALMDGSFLKRAENILAFGPPGTGKTHLLCALAQELIMLGHSAYFTPCNLLVQNLLRAKKELTLEKELKKLSRYDMIIVDDIGYVEQSRAEMEVLFAFIADSYERTSLMITSNLPFSKWNSIFKDPMTTAAAVDRLVHHSVILEMNNQSFRMKEAKSRKKQDK